MQGNLEFIHHEWIGIVINGKVSCLFQLDSLSTAYQFKESIQTSLFAPVSTEPVDITGLLLLRLRMVITSGDLKTTHINPSVVFQDPIWLYSITCKLAFDPLEWKWKTSDQAAKVPFFNYTSKISYNAGM
jgi:hypothetical protein